MCDTSGMNASHLHIRLVFTPFVSHTRPAASRPSPDVTSTQILAGSDTGHLAILSINRRTTAAK